MLPQVWSLFRSLQHLRPGLAEGGEADGTQCLTEYHQCMPVIDPAAREGIGPGARQRRISEAMTINGIRSANGTRSAMTRIQAYGKADQSCKL